MAQVVATRSIQSSFPCPSSGSVQERFVEKLKPSSFSVKALSDEENKNYKFVRSIRRPAIKAQRSVQADVVPVSPEDLPEVCAIFLFTRMSLSI